jgi:hypothetical protein
VVIKMIVEVYERDKFAAVGCRAINTTFQIFGSGVVLASLIRSRGGRACRQRWGKWLWVILDYER